jgi:type IV fimbrial biogenesis protein FimT
MDKKRTGFTLLELLITLSIMATFCAIALPAFQHLQEETEHTQAVNQLISALHLARSHAVRSGQVASVCVQPSLCDPALAQMTSIIVFIDDNKSGKMPNPNALLTQYHVPPKLLWNLKLARHKPFIYFKRNGSTAGLNGTFTLCRDGKPKRQVIVSLSGRARSQKPSHTASC